MKNIWRNLPLHTVLVEILEMKGGSLTDRELYETLKLVYEISYSEFLKTLMKLELQGIIRVETAGEGRLTIELMKR